MVKLSILKFQFTVFNSIQEGGGGGGRGRGRGEGRRGERGEGRGGGEGRGERGEGRGRGMGERAECYGSFEYIEKKKKNDWKLSPRQYIGCPLINKCGCGTFNHAFISLEYYG